MKWFLFPLFVFSSLYIQAQQTKILWLGNSYTNVNDLPGMFHDLALSGGDSVIFDSYSPGGYTLQQHSADASGIQKIYSRQWDYVVIQAQSQEPSFPPSQVEQQTLPYARVLDSLVRDNDSCTETVFYMTWGKKYGDQQNCGNYPVLCSFDGVQSRLRESYLQMGNDNRALVSPVGMAWYKSWHTDSVINLWQTDFSHPLVTGTYLAACVFYGTIFRKSPVGLVYSPISAQPTTTYLQNIAYHTVFDSLTNWNIGTFLPQAEFSFTGDEATKTYSFSAINSSGDNSLEWQFGDGSTGAGAFANHIYNDTGTFRVTLIATDACGKSDSFSLTLTIHLPNRIEEPGKNNFILSPNPACNGVLQLSVDRFTIGKNLSVTDLSGREILSSEIEKERTVIDISNFASGVYYLRIGGAIRKLMRL